MYTPSPAFFGAAAYLTSASSSTKVSNTTKLEVEHLYGLYKHLTVAPTPESPRPSLFDPTGRAKWDAWNTAGKLYADDGREAERRYLDLARRLGWVPGSGGASDSQKKGEEVWDEELGVSISLPSIPGSGGMGGSVSALPAPEGNDTGGQTLHISAIQGHANEISQFLLGDPSVDVDQRDEYGYTALHLACDRGSLPAVRALIEQGADASIKDPDDLTGMELARIAGHDEICSFLQTELH